MENKDHLRQLLRKHIDGTISEAERVELFNSLQIDALADDWRSLIRELSSESMILSDYDESAWEPVIRNILEKPAIVPLPANTVSFRYKRWFRYAAAIAGILVLTSVVYLTFNTKKPAGQPVVENRVGKPVLPGGNKAILTLSDGTSVVLDSAVDGVIRKEGDVKVIKLEDGKLAYNGSPTASASQPVFNTISTPRGGKYQIVLPDGTSVWLNSASSITFPTVFDEDERKVKMEGEAYFEVSHVYSGKSRERAPFIVETATSRITVLGTHFNINAYDDERTVKTTLLEGSVQIDNGKRSVRIKPGEQAFLVGGEDKYRVVRPDIEEVMAWKNGRFLFKDANITSIARQISRWYDVDIQYKGDLSGILFSGGISRKDNIEKLIELLEMDGRVKFKMNGRKLTVSSNE